MAGVGGSAGSWPPGSPRSSPSPASGAGSGASITVCGSDMVSGKPSSREPYEVTLASPPETKEGRVCPGLQGRHVQGSAGGDTPQGAGTGRPRPVGRVSAHLSPAVPYGEAPHQDTPACGTTTPPPTQGLSLPSPHHPHCLVLTTCLPSPRSLPVAPHGQCSAAAHSTVPQPFEGGQSMC